MSDAKNHFETPNGIIWGLIFEPESDPRDDHETLIFGSLFGHPCGRCGGEVIPHCAPKPGTSINKDISNNYENGQMRRFAFRKSLDFW